MYKAINNLTKALTVVMMGFTLNGQAQTNTSKPIDNGIVVMELFTSQGCSSCPPADEVLAKYALANKSNIIPLAFHVDYWNYIGWKDPFSQADYSKRQQKYASYFHSNGVYTPQLVINGKHQLVGSKEKEIDALVSKEALINNTASIKINTTIKENKLIVKYSTNDIANNRVVNIALVKKKEFTKIKRGENNGLKQTNYAIVYDFKSFPLTDSKETQIPFNFQNNWLKSDFIVVAYIQDNQNGKIITAIKKELN